MNNPIPQLLLQNNGTFDLVCATIMNDSESFIHHDTGIVYKITEVLEQRPSKGKFRNEADRWQWAKVKAVPGNAPF